jgi:ABC-type bacteriocin/lantibiotic exporter with double-glycine peptidase domain
LQTVAETLKPKPVLGPPARSLPSSREVGGADALAHLFNYYGLKVGLNELLRSIQPGRHVAEMSDLLNEAIARGFRAELVELSKQQIDEEIMPLLVKMKDARVAVLIGLNDEIATIYEQNFGYGYIKREEFETLWNGRVLRIRPPPIKFGDSILNS